MSKKPSGGSHDDSEDGLSDLEDADYNEEAEEIVRITIFDQSQTVLSSDFFVCVCFESLFR
jgi:hypothetical protein